jgi:hypothetical protein
MCSSGLSLPHRQTGTEVEMALLAGKTRFDPRVYS